MALKSDKNLKLYYSIREVAEMFDVNESLCLLYTSDAADECPAV